MAFTLFDEGDYLLVPTPYFPGFDHTFTKRFGLNFLKAPMEAKDNFKHNIDCFKKAYDTFEQKEKLKAILITHPHNPTGEILSKKFIKDIINFAKERQLQIISDEIYALSTHWQEDHLSLYQEARKNNVTVHLLYGLAKDFSLPSFKVGLYYSEDNEVVTSLKKQAYFSPVSIQTQELALNILNDHLFITQFKTLNQERLNKSLRRIKTDLPHLNFLPSEAGLFTILDLSSKCESFEAEDELFNHLIDNLKINITKGSDFGFSTPGYFRLCFAQPEENIKELCKRLKGL
jgi:aspartate/methionine/tyrosine aminotransferase